jgi:hypothetical protein
LSKSDVFTKGIPALDSDNFSVHGQTTFVSQYALPFRAPYSGQNSLASNAGRETFDIDLYFYTQLVCLRAAGVPGRDFRAHPERRSAVGRLIG